jgi:hypothetical protein
MKIFIIWEKSIQYIIFLVKFNLTHEGLLSYKMKIINFISVSHFNFFFFDFIDEFFGFIVLLLLNATYRNCKVYLFLLMALFISHCDQITNVCFLHMMRRFFIQLSFDFLCVFIHLV